MSDHVNERLADDCASPGLQQPTMFEVMDGLYFLSDSEFKQAQEDGGYHLIIVGSGFCALAVAKRFLKNNPSSRILILERGPLLLPDHIHNLPLPFARKLCKRSETFPWTVSASTKRGEGGTIRWQHGMMPFVGGRSLFWSGWCPRPTPEEMFGWPEDTIRDVRAYFGTAEELLHVQRADEVDNCNPPSVPRGISNKKQTSSSLQQVVGKLLKSANRVKDIDKVEPALLASNGKCINRNDTQKFAVPGELLKLAHGCQKGGGELHIAINATVKKINHQDGVARYLETSRGVIRIGDAQLVLAMGSMPPTTLVQNSFPDMRSAVGERFSSHTVTHIVARIPICDLTYDQQSEELKIGAFYITGTVGGDYKKQFHIQLRAQGPGHGAQSEQRYIPKLGSTASQKQLDTSKDYAVFICGVLGEMDADNKDNWFRYNPNDSDPTTNSVVQLYESASDKETWDAMDAATFGILETVLSPKGSDRVQYWHGKPESGDWDDRRPDRGERRADFVLHESSTLHIGEDESAPVDLEYRLRGTSNVYITGGALWPRGGSWNPTMVMVAMAQHLADILSNKSQRKSEKGSDRCCILKSKL